MRRRRRVVRLQPLKTLTRMSKPSPGVKESPLPPRVPAGASLERYAGGTGEGRRYESPETRSCMAVPARWSAASGVLLRHEDA